MDVTAAFILFVLVSQEKCDYTAVPKFDSQ